MPEIVKILLIVLGCIAVSGLIFGFVLTMMIAKRVFLNTLARKNPEHWGRVCSAPENEEQMTMWNIGCSWAKDNSQYMEEVSITNESLKLVGEFYNFGNDKTVIILPGRCESLCYSYYYAAPYKENGYNVLCIDPRAHGLSEGKFNSCGIHEASDLKAWINFINQERKQNEVCIHALCVGGSATLIALTKEDAPKCVNKIVFDGLFESYKEIYKNHYVELGHKKFPVFYEIWFFFRYYNKASINKSVPKNYLPLLKTSVLFIYSDKDIYSLPEKSKKLIEMCGSEDKNVKWFSKGAHSHVRLNNTEEYDQTLKEFLSK